MLESKVLIVLAVTLMCVHALAQSPDCPFQECTCIGARIDCTSRGLTTLPTLRPGAFKQTILDISRNQISSIEDGQLPTGLRSIISVNNPIKSLSGGAFQASAETLTTLVLANGQLESVPDALGSLKHVQAISLRGNLISDMSPLFSLPALVNVDLRDNKLENHQHIPKALTPHTTSLKVLNLGENSLSQIPDLSFLTSLESLYLDSNPLSDVTHGLLPTSLKHLYLDNVHLTSVPPAVAQLPRLQMLFMDKNHIKSVDGVGFPASLHTLSLSENEIERFSGLTFVGGPSQLVDLHLSESPLTTITEEAFANTPGLLRLFLSQTKLKRLPLALAALKKLQHLTLTQIDGLACTCEEAALSEWISARHLMNLQGDCGNSPIKFFLLYLAPQCPH